MFVSELRSIARFCNFEGTLETMLQSCIICRINDTIIQRCLLAEKALTFKTTLELAQGMESAAKNVRELSVPASARDIPPTTRPTAAAHLVNQVGDSAANKPSLTCFRCGKLGHYAPTYKHKETICKKCGKLGHLQKMCRSKPTRKKPPASKPVNNVQAQGDATEEYQLLNITSSGKATPWNVLVDIEGIMVSMQEPHCL